jgi:hypothetical protein
LDATQQDLDKLKKNLELFYSLNKIKINKLIVLAIYYDLFCTDFGIEYTALIPQQDFEGGWVLDDLGDFFANFV